MEEPDVEAHLELQPEHDLIQSKVPEHLRIYMKKNIEEYIVEQKKYFKWMWDAELDE